jgi:DNA modification methylase
VESIPKAIKAKSIVSRAEWREYTKTVWRIANVSDPVHPAVFPVEIPYRLIKLFSFHGELVLDPFAGIGTTARAAIPLGRRVICVDQNPSYVDAIKTRCASLSRGRSAPELLTAVSGDSRSLSSIADNSVGLVVTSPPYWNKADYGEGESNLGSIGHYGEFLKMTRQVFAECLRVLRPGRKLCVVTANVNQHTDHGLLTFPLAADFLVQARALGFVLINEIIWSKEGTGGKWGSWGSQRPIFGSYPYPPNFLFKNVHEYILILAKAPQKRVSGKTVRAYADLIGAPDGS